MNKELIKKYKAEFDWWVDDGSILYKVNGSNFNERNWLPMTEHNPIWEPNFTYIINDEYVEFRKAQAEGKQLQWQDNYHKVWECGFINKFTLTLNRYRIKPDESKFPYYAREKSSGIVVKFEKRSNPNCYSLSQELGVVVESTSQLAQQTLGFTWRCWDTFSNPERWEHLPNYCDEPKFKVGDWVMRDSNLKTIVQIVESDLEKNLHLKGLWYKWRPQPGEWCWYGYEIVQVLDCCNLDRTKICRQNSNSYEEINVARLEPFIGTLPSIIKD